MLSRITHCSSIVNAVCRPNSSLSAGSLLRHAASPATQVHGREVHIGVRVERHGGGGGSEEERYWIAEEAEELERWMGSKMQDQRLDEEVHRDKEQARKKLVHQIIKRKYFRSAQETNLLTWSGKEQLRYLHSEDPAEWTVERLSQSFSVSHDGVRKILRSKFAPKTPEEIENHDRRVSKHWKALGVDKPTVYLGDGGTTVPQQLLGSVNSTLSLPKPLRSLMENDKESLQDRRRPGRFESLVKDYCEKQKLEAVKSNTIDKHNVSNVNLAISDGNKLRLQAGRKAKNDSVSSHMEADESERLDRRATKRQSRTELHLSKDASRLQSDFRSTDSMDAVWQSESMIDVDFKARHDTFHGAARNLTSDDDEFYVSDRSSVQRRSHSLSDAARLDRPGARGEVTSYKSASNSSSRSHSELGVRSSRAVSASSDSFPNRRNRADSRERSDYIVGRKKEVQSNVYKEIRYDEGRKGKKEAYVYEEGKGYRHPYGRQDALPEPRLEGRDRFVKVEKGGRRRDHSEGAVYQKGRDFYDADGELLYRTP